MRYRFLRFPEGKGKALTFSYDDGVREDLRFANTISKYRIKCTFNFTNADHLNNDEVMDCILSKGHEIAIHGALHKAPGLVRPIEGIYDILSCRKELENKYDLIIRGMAYPDTGINNLFVGNTYEGIKSYLKELDIAYARTAGGDNDLFRLPEDWYAWMPTAHHMNPELFGFIDKFLNLDISLKQYDASRYPRLFYLWGHSYEFERNNNWDLLENICKKLGNRDDIWYATNMEIYNYVNAYNSLIYSADGQIIYNPTLITIWFETEGKIYFVKSGDTIRL